MLCVATLIAAMYHSITDYISLLGSFCSTTCGVVIPGLIYIKANEYHLLHWKNQITILIIAIVALMGITSGIITIMGMIDR